jgi:Ni,Fe-hydrogenase maturation factor
VQKEGEEAVLFKNGEILENATISISTHNLPFSSIYDFLKESSDAAVWFLGIRPHSYDNLTSNTIKIAKRVINVFNSLDNKSKINIIDLYETLSTTLK